MAIGVPDRLDRVVVGTQVVTAERHAGNTGNDRGTAPRDADLVEDEEATWRS
jgi:hypothetical protein